jgi:hypothetical protein
MVWSKLLSAFVDIVHCLLTLCHLFSRQETRKIEILYIYSVVVFGLALLPQAKEA